MKAAFIFFLTSLTHLFDLLRGARQLRIVAVHDSPEEAYRLETSHGGRITLYCTETIYEIVFDCWWVKTQRHVSYQVYGHCDTTVPEPFCSRIQAGLHIGQLLPATASRQHQKQAAIHAHVSLIIAELAVSNAQPR